MPALLERTSGEPDMARSNVMVFVAIESSNMLQNEAECYGVRSD